ncbi:MAG: ribosomal protein S18-alanine N-acetyltransferase [Deltaproteobacteria bacterium]|nr:ribosomal protein S18-alanine N-acetyltransferase [Deltaproteobacteria bacterium]
MTENHLARIRTFKAEDIDNILEIERQAYPKTPYSKVMFLNYFAYLPDTFVVVESDKDIMGYIIFDLTGHIYSMAVEPSYRRKGFGKMLFNYALRRTGKRLWLEVRSKNRGAINFYKKIGMKVVGNVPNYYGDDDALIMLYL